MKTKHFVITTLLALSAITSSLEAQIKVFSSGKLSLGTTEEPDPNYRVRLHGAWFMMGGYQNRFLRYDLSPSDPRIWSTTNKIVFFNTDALQFQDLQARNFYQSSDEKLKANIEPITNGLDIITQLRGTKYNWKSDLSASANSTTLKEAGFIAQEIERILPEAVITDSIDNKLISYNSILVYAVEAIKELTYIVQKQEAVIKEMKEGYSLKSGSKSEEPSGFSHIGEEPLLLSNVPNPFTEVTEISYYIPATANNALLLIYDMQGMQIKKLSIDAKGNSSVKITAADLKSGMYLYTLLVDGKEAGTKRMIVL